MQCPYCDVELKDTEELNFHALKFHPDKTSLEEYREDKIARIWGTALDLTAVCIHFKDAEIPKEKVLENFKYFLRELMKSEK